MKRLVLFSGLFLLLSTSASSYAPASPADYFEPLAYRYVGHLPDAADRKVILVSIRNLETAAGLKIKRGLQPRLQLHYFIVGTTEDSAYISSRRNLQEAMAALDSDLNLMVYVDGHGKTFGQNLLRGKELAWMYGMNLIVFDWPTDYFSLRKTFDNSFEASAGLARLLEELNQFRTKTGQKQAVTAFFHSMGNQLLKNLADQDILKDLPRDLLDNLVLNAAAVRQRNHDAWIGTLAMQKRIYITLNDGDRPLRGATLLRLAHQLGLGPGRQSAGNAVYVDFSPVATTEHNLFLGMSAAEKEYSQISAFFQTVLHGKDFPFDAANGFQWLSEGRVSAIAESSAPDGT